MRRAMLALISNNKYPRQGFPLFDLFSHCIILLIPMEIRYFQCSFLFPFSFRLSFQLSFSPVALFHYLPFSYVSHFCFFLYLY